MQKRVVIANDHGAIELKGQIISHLESRGYQVVNLGVNENESVDYPDIAADAAREYLKKEDEYAFGIVCCGTGIGISVSVNKIPGIRCALPQNAFAAQMAKEHNNANFLAFGGRIEYPDSVEKMLDIFLDSKYEGGRHQRRVDKMMALDQE